jgi:hypothetical protein
MRSCSEEWWHKGSAAICQTADYLDGLQLGFILARPLGGLSQFRDAVAFAYQ